MRTNAEYRKYMTDNATSIIQDNMRYACDNLNARLSVAPVQQTRVGEPHLFTSSRSSLASLGGSDAATFGYETNATKEAFLDECAGAATYRDEYSLRMLFM